MKNSILITLGGRFLAEAKGPDRLFGATKPCLGLTRRMASDTATRCDTATPIPIAIMDTEITVAPCSQ